MGTVKVGDIIVEIPDVQGELSRQEQRQVLSLREQYEALRKALTKEERERGRRELEARAKKYGYEPGDNAHLIKPKEYRDVPESQFADPVGFNYPVDTPKRARAALAYFIRHHGAYKDVNAKIFIYERILRALKKFGIKRHFNPDWPGDWLVSPSLKKWMEGYDKYADEDTEEKREEMKRKWMRMEKSWLQKQLGQNTSHIVTLAPRGSITADEAEVPSLAEETVSNFFDQLLETITKALEKFFGELFDKVGNLVEENFQKYAEALAEATSDLADALKDFIKELKGEEVEEEEAPSEAEELPTPPEEGAAETVAPVAPPLPPAGGEQVPPPAPEERAPAPVAPAPAATPAGAFAKAMSAWLATEWEERFSKEKKEDENSLPYLRATEEFLRSAEGLEFIKATRAVADMLVKRHQVIVDAAGNIQLKEIKEGNEEQE